MARQLAGSRARRITIQARAGGSYPDGQPISDWSDIATVWANVKAPTGLSSIVAAGDVPLSVTRYSFRIRYRSGLDAGMRVLMASVAYDITAVLMDEGDKEWTDLVCTRGANNG